MNSFKARLVLLSAAGVLATSGPASAAVQAGPSYSPWAALSAFASQGSSAALCGTSANAAMATATNAGSCAMPQVDAAVAASVETAGVAAPAGLATTSVTGIGTVPLFAGLAVLVGLAALVLGDSGSGGDEIVARPVSPP